MAVRRLRHLRIGIGEPAEAVQIEPPDMESGATELVPPGAAVEAVRDRERRGESAAMDIQDDLAVRHHRAGGWEIAEEQRKPLMGAGYAEMLFAGIEPRCRAGRE